jgi:hypothetical protein
MARTRSLGGIVGTTTTTPKETPPEHVGEVDQAVSDPAPPTRAPKPVRITVDLPPGRHAALQRWCLDAAPGVGQPRVHGQQVMRALIGRLLTDELLSRAIIADLRGPVT